MKEVCRVCNADRSGVGAKQERVLCLSQVSEVAKVAKIVGNEWHQMAGVPTTSYAS